MGVNLAGLRAARSSHVCCGAFHRLPALVVPVGVAAGFLAAILIVRRLWIAMLRPATAPITAGAAR